jgi:hypothetical protein
MAAQFANDFRNVSHFVVFRELTSLWGFSFQRQTGGDFGLCSSEWLEDTEEAPAILESSGLSTAGNSGRSDFSRTHLGPTCSALRIFKASRIDDVPDPS